MELDNKTKAITIVRELFDRADADWEFIADYETNGNTCKTYKKLGLEGEPYTVFQIKMV